MVGKRYLSMALMAAGVLLVAAAGTIIHAKAVEPVSDRQIILFLHFENDEISIIKVKLRNVPYKPPRGGYSGTWKIELLAIGKDKLLYEKRFMDPTVMFWDDVDPETGEIIDGGMEHLDTVDFIMALPDLEGARRIKVYRQKVLQTPEPKSIDHLINVVQLPPREEWEVIP